MFPDRIPTTMVPGKPLPPAAAVSRTTLTNTPVSSFSPLFYIVKRWAHDDGVLCSSKRCMVIFSCCAMFFFMCTLFLKHETTVGWLLHWSVHTLQKHNIYVYTFFKRTLQDVDCISQSRGATNRTRLVSYFESWPSRPRTTVVVGYNVRVWWRRCRCCVPAPIGF